MEGSRCARGARSNDENGDIHLLKHAVYTYWPEVKSTVILPKTSQPCGVVGIVNNVVTGVVRIEQVFVHPPSLFEYRFPQPLRRDMWGSDRLHPTATVSVVGISRAG